jgi:hypothetical protein
MPLIQSYEKSTSEFRIVHFKRLALICGWVGRRNYDRPYARLLFVAVLFAPLQDSNQIL